MALLHKAVAMGYRSPDAFRTEDALDPLRDRADFRLLMMDLAMPAEPFAAVARGRDTAPMPGALAEWKAGQRSSR